MQDIKIGNIKLNSIDELSFKVIVKAGDYTPVELQLLKNAEINGDMLDLQFTGLVSGDIEKVRKEKLQKLHGLMTMYCEKAHINFDEEKARLNIRNKVSTRTELSNLQLDYEIELYINGLKEY